MNNLLLKVSLQFKIDKLIEEAKLTKTSFAKKIGISRDSVYNLDEKTRLSTFLKICEFFKVPMSELIDEDYLKKTAETQKLNVIKEESEVYQAVNYKEKYFSTLEKLNAANEKLLKLQDSIKKSK